MSLLPFCQWLADTRGSIALHESLYMYPLVESVHVLTLCLFVGMSVLLDLRLLGLTLPRVPVSVVTSRLLPWMQAGFAIMIVSGVLLFYAIPVRSYQNIFFRIKLVALAFAGLNAWLFHIGIHETATEWDLDRVAPRAARAAGAASLVLWAVIIVCGRMIAYNWFDCDKQPQPHIVNVLAGCVVETKEGSRFPVPGSRFSVLDSERAANREPGTGEPGTRNPRTKNQEPGTGNREP